MLTGAQKRHLRALAHPLEPVIQIGHKGLTDSVIHEIDQALIAHELIKVKLLPNTPAEVDEAAEQIAQSTGGVIAQTIGRVIVVYRPAEDPDDRKIELPGE